VLYRTSLGWGEPEYFGIPRASFAIASANPFGVEVTPFQMLGVIRVPGDMP
jgi:hypothetical protein